MKLNDPIKDTGSSSFSLFFLNNKSDKTTYHKLKTRAITSNLGTVKQQKKKNPKEDTRIRDPWVHTLSFSKRLNQKLWHMQQTWCRPAIAPCLLLQCLWTHMSSEGRGLVGTSHLELCASGFSLYMMSGCGSLHHFHPPQEAASLMMTE